jgi:hypothetical protein
VNRHEKVGRKGVRASRSFLERDEAVIVTREQDLETVSHQDARDAMPDVERNFFLNQAAWAHRAPVFASMPWVDNNP